jgi:aspartokinase-like uncharacterized kinase
VVPGGGPFADAVRDVDPQLQPSDSAAHWMAILAMDQYAYLIAERIADGTIVETPRTIGTALKAGQVPVLAPFRWMRDADPLPHSWDVTSDSIAAWIAGELGATDVILIKPPALVEEAFRPPARDLVDPHFHRTLRDGIRSVVVPADQIDVLRSALQRTSCPPSGGP